MLYQIYEMNHAAMTPLRESAKLRRRLYRSAYNPASFTPVGKSVAAVYDLFESVTRRYGKPDWGIQATEINGFSVPVRERVVWSKPFCDLLHFERGNGQLEAVRDHDQVDPRVLIVAPLSGHYSTLLRKTVEAFLPDHEVYITDWADARDVSLDKGSFDLTSYIDYVIEIIEFLGPKANVVAICQPGPPVLAAISLMSEDDNPNLPATLTVMGSPIDPRRSPTTPNRIAQERPYSWFKSHLIHTVPLPNPGFMRPVYPGFLQLGGFMSMNSSRHITAHQDYFKKLVKGDRDSAVMHREFYDEYLAVLDMTAEFYLQTIWDVFKEHKLPKGTFAHHGRLVKPEAITRVGLMTVEGEHDDISGIGQTQAAHDLCRNIPEAMKRDYIQPGVGHYGVFNGRRFREEIQPRIANFFREHMDRDEERELQKQLTRKLWTLANHY